MGHIDPGTGRNKRETGKLVKMRDSGGKGGHIRKSAGKPIERRIDQKRRNATRGRS
jgi:hypothetical protein